MAGMLPGVECARWRRSHQSRDPPTSAAHRRSSFCMYATSNDNIFHNSSIPSLKENERSILEMESEDEKLGGVAKKAKDRLDEKLRSKRKSDDTIARFRRQNSKEVMGSNEELQTDGVKKSSSSSSSSSSRVKKFNWGRVLRWKEVAGGGQDESSTSISVLIGSGGQGRRRV